MVVSNSQQLQCHMTDIVCLWWMVDTLAHCLQVALCISYMFTLLFRKQLSTQICRMYVCVS